MLMLRVSHLPRVRWLGQNHWRHPFAKGIKLGLGLLAHELQLQGDIVEQTTILLFK
jgi:hypothetical protein